MKSISSAKWNITGQVAIQLLNVGGTIVLSRWLPPGAVGLLLMLSLISNFVAIIFNHVIGNAVVQNSSLNNKDLSSIFWMNIFIAAFFHILLFLFSPVISAFYKEDQILKYLPYFGTVFFFYALGGVSQALLVKRHAFKRIVAGNLVGITVSFSVAIFMVAQGYGVESLFVQLLLNTFISSLFFFIAEKWKPLFHFSFSSLKKVRRFVSHLLFNSSLEYLVFNLDNFIVGRFFGNTGLGLYGRARQWVFLPVQNVAFSISRSFFPTFVQLKDDFDSLQKTFLFSFRLSFYLTCILLIFMVVSAGDLVHIFLGEQWLEIVPLFIWFSFTGIVGTINGFNDSFITSQGKTGLLLRTGIFEKIFTVAGLLLAIPYGLKGLVIARLITSLCIVIPKTYVALRVARISFSKWMHEILPALSICFLLLVAGITSVRALDSISGIARLSIVSGVYLLLLIILSYLFKEPAYQTLLKAILHRKKPEPK